MNAPTPAVSLSGVYKRFGPLEVLRGISLDAAEGEVISILVARIICHWRDWRRNCSKRDFAA